ncbi:hypothetical protein ACFSKW_01160 [Nonomuraea mangrovi]|uniref:Uncharacterized protein n=1 Tax=Nonomuraea mangrovi TaxID=2316207 RepID=A0ABW4SKJ8_9ACTN
MPHRLPKRLVPPTLAAPPFGRAEPGSTGTPLLTEGWELPQTLPHRSNGGAATFTGDYVRVKGTGPGVTSQAQPGAGTTGSVNGIGIRVLSLSGGKVALRLAPRR